MEYQGLICVLLISLIIWLLVSNSKILHNSADSVQQGPKNIANSFDAWLNRQAGVLPA